MVVVPTRQVIDARSPVKRPVPDKAIFWPTAAGFGDHPPNCDSTRFPKLQAIKARNGASPAEPLTAFLEAVMEAQDRVLIMDEYFFNPEEGGREWRVDQVRSWFPDFFVAADVRLLTTSFGDPVAEENIIRRFTIRAAEINNASAYPTGVTISVKFSLRSEFPYVHDRFAIIDDELWHFGATVGGFHGKVNAATRGWSADDHHARDFFDLAWDGDPDITRVHARRSGRR